MEFKQKNMVFSLLNHPWFPTTAGTKSLFDLASELDTIEDVHGSAIARVSLYRFILCLSHAALDGPATKAERNNLTASQLSAALKVYLTKWAPVFQSDTFLQLPADAYQTEKPVPLRDLYEMTERKKGSGLRLGPHFTAPSSEDAMWRLLVLQNYAPSGRIGAHRWHGVYRGDKGAKKKLSAKYPPAQQSSAYHVFLLGNNLFETIRHNLVPKDFEGLRGVVWGKPVWEELPLAVASPASDTYLGRLVPLSRGVRIEGDLLHYSEAVIYTDAPKGYEQSVSRQLVKDKELGDVLKPVRIFPGRESWRDLSAILALGAERAAACLRLSDPTKERTIWLGGLCYNNSPIAEADSQFILPAAQDDGTEFYNQYTRALLAADTESDLLGRAVYSFSMQNSGSSSTVASRQASAVAAAAKQHYWGCLRAAVPRLLRDWSALPKEGVLEQKNLTTAWRSCWWGQEIINAAKAGFDHTCPQTSAKAMRIATPLREKL